ncbi:ShlB/FhaC/HecB family hemolysin secretion/activation protein [Herminiimonas glaciei]|uniref:ShlB/FhaC/HecB family hemolysin secretion/activation protein n=1 Tax=Herminiimonas glaciei TaxID=523788 RepID=A0ABW2IBT9_9BURK
MKRNIVVSTRLSRKPLSAIVAACAVMASLPASAQIPPDAGRVLQQQAPVIEAPKEAPGITIETAKPSTVPAGGVQVAIQSVAIQGNSLFTEAKLLQAVGDVSGKSYDAAGLRELANRVSGFYHAAGYPFARAYLPPQNMQSGVLRIDVVEGRYGKVLAQGDGSLVEAAQRFLAPLRPGSVIQSTELERVSLLMDDLPGVRVAPIIRPGQELGTGDLAVQIERTAKYTGDVGLDNHGNRYTGRARARANLDINSPFMLGDQVNLRSLYTEEGMWFGNVAYSMPLGVSGLRGQVSYTHTYYQLGKSFAALDANGTADVYSAGLSYPILRSQKTNLTLSATYQYKKLNDKRGAVGSSNDKSSDTLPVALSFDTRDQFGGGAVTYGAVTWTPGKLKLDQTLRSLDALSARAEGSFNKVNLDIARIQAVTDKFNLFGRMSAQWSDENLDSSEKFGLGGPTGIRAYPVGESYGDQGWLAQFEARYAVGAFVPYAFYDAGWIKTNSKPWTSADNKRSIGGYGLGVRFAQNQWSVDAAVAWRTYGGRPESDTADHQPMGWITAGYKF